MSPRAPVAVVGMAGLFPGASELTTFWQNIVTKVDTTREVPPDRWVVNPDSIYDPQPRPDKVYSKRCCLIKNFRFDPVGLDIDKDLALALDPLYHMVLHVGRQALAGIPAGSIHRERTGAVLSAISLPTETSSKITREVMGSAFEEKLQPIVDATTPGGNFKPLSRHDCLAARVTGLPGAVLAKAFGLGAGTLTLDAACASSLYAVKLACDELLAHRADAMLAGGVSRPDCLFTQVGFSQLRALSSSGRCAPFDESADGLVVGEGAGILVLKRLADARRDQDKIYGLIHGIGLANDMRGNLIAPDSEGQLRAMQSAYQACGWSPFDIDLIECHGAGTPLGDQTELQSLKMLWGESGWTKGQCAIGSVKSMIGHLLTAAGAAGMIKTLLALYNEILPPSLNFQRAPRNIHLQDTPFRVQTEPHPWQRRSRGQPRRAAVSAFGFGGINAHLLLEGWDPNTESARRTGAWRPTARLSSSSLNSLPTGAPRSETRWKSSLAPSVDTVKSETPHSDLALPADDIAIVGMETAFGSTNGLRDFQETVFKGATVITKRPQDRWKGFDAVVGRHGVSEHLAGAFIGEMVLDISQFHIPPKEIPDILPQHLLMLKVAAGAMMDAQLPLRAERPRMGAIIGVDFDFEATNFHLRWYLAARFGQRTGEETADAHTAAWMQSLQDACHPPLTATRTLGALGGMVASRIAREFRFGGPSFGVSCEEAAGLKALEIAVRSLQQKEADAFLVGAVDLSGDPRNIILTNRLRPFSKQQVIRPFDRLADGTLAGEGAAAVIVKRLDRALADGDRIYAVIKGIGKASGGGIGEAAPSVDAYTRSLENCFEDAGIAPSTISLLETHGSGDPCEDELEAKALHEFFKNHKGSCAIGSVKANIGHSGAASALASLVKSALCLYHEIIPPLSNFTAPKSHLWQNSCFHFPAFPQFWLRDRKEGPRRALMAAITRDGNCMQVILEGPDYPTDSGIHKKTVEKVELERKHPLGWHQFGLFAVEGDDTQALLAGLDALNQHVEAYRASTAADPRSAGRLAIEPIARTWHLRKPVKAECKLSVCLGANDLGKLGDWIADAKQAVSSDTPRQMGRSGGIWYSPNPLGSEGSLAFVFPGSGNHYPGMGRDIGVRWPEILREMDRQTLELKAQLLPGCFVPWRVSWEPGWQREAYQKIISDPLNMIFGQVVHGGVVAKLISHFGVRPSAVIGYSLGESAGYFAMGVWPERGRMLERMRQTDLFSTQLAGPCEAARKAWNLPPDEDVAWCVAVVNRSAAAVRRIVKRYATARLLIVNTPAECVIGGRRHDVRDAIEALGCEAVFLDGVVTVHCDALLPVADRYRELHRFPTHPPEGIRFYSCALGRAYSPDSEKAAASILNQALHGFDFTATVKRAYRDGVRLFLEMGPYTSCTRMINSILQDRPHLAVSACVRGEDDYTTILKVLGALIAERVPVDLEKLYGRHAFAPGMIEPAIDAPDRKVKVVVGGRAPLLALPVSVERLQNSEDKGQPPEVREERPVASDQWSEAGPPFSDLIDAAERIAGNTSVAHQKYLEITDEINRSYAEAFDLQTRLLERALEESEDAIPAADFQTADSGIAQPEYPLHSSDISPSEFDAAASDRLRPRAGRGELVTDRTANFIPAFSREACLEFARGSIAKVLGAQFAEVDGYAARVRLPDEPLMLVDRIISIEGEKGSLGPGRITTEHDVLPGVWYLDGGHAPVCISVEAGQADLFLCAYLGIDLRVKGKRTYRLLDATVKFHRELPVPGETLRYDIAIQKFIRQGETYLFLFNFIGYIGDSLLITMTNGCAGFFTAEEVKNSGGIILTEDDTGPAVGKKPPDWKDVVSIAKESYTDSALQCLRDGNPAGCFGSRFEGIKLPAALRLPGGRMKLIDRVLEIDPNGGRYGLGLIRAEADIRPDAWFLTCHFVDDMVMPGTLMYECCAHTLRVLLQRMGWMTDKPGVYYGPVIGVESTLKCRGPVTPDTRKVIYEIELSEIGYGPEPFVIADAHMFADGHRIVYFRNMSLQLTGATRHEIESFWAQKRSPSDHRRTPTVEPPVFGHRHMLEFAEGSPSKAFGDPYRPFDGDRFIARLPRPPYLLIDRIIKAEPAPWVLRPGGWIEAESDIDANAWFFRAEGTPIAPISILLEIGLQPCGWLAAYLGSALRSQNDLRFRNLGGKAAIYRELASDAGTLTIRARLTNAAEAADMIIEHFDFEVRQRDRMIYAGNTYFGFFTQDALARQEGIREAAEQTYVPAPEEIQRGLAHEFLDFAPLRPDDETSVSTPALAMPARAIRMIDRIDVFVPDGGPKGLGFIRGTKSVDPREWFFQAHFYQDPVCPGSLGIESFIQLLKFAACQRWPQLSNSHRFGPLVSTPHSWTYRGQITPANHLVTVEAVVSGIRELPSPAIIANGTLKVDGLVIYKLENFGIQLVPVVPFSQT